MSLYITQVELGQSFGEHVDENLIYDAEIDTISKTIASGIGILRLICSAQNPDMQYNDLQPHFDGSSVACNFINNYHRRTTTISV